MILRPWRPTPPEPDLGQSEATVASMKIGLAFHNRHHIVGDLLRTVHEDEVSGDTLLCSRENFVNSFALQQILFHVCNLIIYHML